MTAYCFSLRFLSVLRKASNDDVSICNITRYMYTSQSTAVRALWEITQSRGYSSPRLSQMLYLPQVHSCMQYFPVVHEQASLLPKHPTHSQVIKILMY